MTAERHWWETRRFALAMIMLAAVPLLWPAIPPLTDLPGHMGRYRVMLGTDADQLAQWFGFTWRLTGNLGVDLIVRALAPLTGLEPAVKLAVLAIPMATAAGALWISREVHGRVQPWAIAALPLAYNYAFHFGFVNYALAMAMALNALGLWLWLTRAGRFAWRACLFVPIALLVWAAHIVGWGVLGLLVFASEVARLRDQGASWLHAAVRAAIASASLALPLVLILVWRSSDGAGVTLGWFLWAFKAGWLAMVVRDRWVEFDLAAAIVFGVMLYHGWRSPGVGQSRGLGLGALLLAAAYLVIPFRILDSAYADMRLAPYLVMVALLGLRAEARFDPRKLRVIAALALAFLLVRTAGTTLSYWLYDRSWKSHFAALDHVPRGARVVALVGEVCEQPWSWPRVTHLPSMAIVRRAAFANDQWQLGAGSPLTITAHFDGFEADPSQIVLARTCRRTPYLRTIDEALRRLPRDRFDYLWLIAPPPFDPRLTAGMRPVWRNGTNALYRIDQPGLSAIPSSH